MINIAFLITLIGLALKVNLEMVDGGGGMYSKSVFALGVCVSV